MGSAVDLVAGGARQASGAGGPRPPSFDGGRASGVLGCEGESWGDGLGQAALAHRPSGFSPDLRRSPPIRSPPTAITREEVIAFGGDPGPGFSGETDELTYPGPTGGG